MLPILVPRLKLGAEDRLHLFQYLDQRGEELQEEKQEGGETGLIITVLEVQMERALLLRLNLNRSRRKLGNYQHQHQWQARTESRHFPFQSQAKMVLLPDK
jgi:hypothetical protein